MKLVILIYFFFVSGKLILKHQRCQTHAVNADHINTRKTSRRFNIFKKVDTTPVHYFHLYFNILNSAHSNIVGNKDTKLKTLLCRLKVICTCENFYTLKVVN